MAQRSLTKEHQKREGYEQFFKDRMKTFAGFQMDFKPVNTFDETPERREVFFEELWQKGGFHFWLAAYQDMLFDEKANREAYNFWAKKARARIHDPRKRDILAPLEPPHAFGTKRPSLEQDFNEQFNKDNVDVIDIRANPIVEVKPEGILTSDGTLHELDVIALATGFDSVTGGMKNMGLRNIYGEELSDTWKMGTWSYLGMTCNGYPNMFFLCGAQGPTAFSNGPFCVEVQGDWIVDAIKKIKDENVNSINPTKDAEEAWRKNVKELSDKTLFPGTSSWYMGANIPGKPREQLNYAGGIPLYEEEYRKALKNWDGFEVVVT
jgi:cation diffusion facilitator CzcD-associated flavoprotein CzcO